MSRSKATRHEEPMEGVEPAIWRKSSATIRPKGETTTGNDSDRKTILRKQKRVLQTQITILQDNMRKRDSDRKGKSEAVSAKDRSEAKPERARPEGVALTPKDRVLILHAIANWNPKNTSVWDKKGRRKKGPKNGPEKASLLLDK